MIQEFKIEKWGWMGVNVFLVKIEDGPNITVIGKCSATFWFLTSISIARETNTVRLLCKESPSPYLPVK